MDEREAVARLKDGDIGGLEALVEMYQTRAVRVAYLVCRDPALAEDIVQSAFIRAYERIAQFDSERPFAPWFLRMVVNATLNTLKHQGRLHPLNVQDDDNAGLPDHEPIDSEAILPEAILERAETISLIAATMNQLTAQQRAALVMRYYLDLSENEMAEQLKIAPGTVKWRLHAARERMRQLLPAWLTGE